MAGTRSQERPPSLPALPIPARCWPTPPSTAGATTPSSTAGCSAPPRRAGNWATAPPPRAPIRSRWSTDPDRAPPSPGWPPSPRPGTTPAPSWQTAPPGWGDSPAGPSTAPVTILADATHPLTGITALAAGDSPPCAARRRCRRLLGSNADGLLGDGGSENASSTPVHVIIGAGAPPVPMNGVSGLVLGHDFPGGHERGPVRARLRHRLVGFNRRASIAGASATAASSASQAAAAGRSSPGATPSMARLRWPPAGTFSCALLANGSVSCRRRVGTSSSDGCLDRPAPV